MLQIAHYTKRYGNKVAVDDLSLEIQAGEIFGFIGHNRRRKDHHHQSGAGIFAL